jgi:hypothetical protein
VKALLALPFINKLTFLLPKGKKKIKLSHLLIITGLLIEHVPKSSLPAKRRLAFSQKLHGFR